ncbi:PAS domain S-box-containing protein [Desulfonatronum zhilinae]|nr:PAS domain S-box-containing protein [Desulfonatronum zhilinae]
MSCRSSEIFCRDDLEALFSNAPIGIFSSNPDGRFISVNPAMARMYGYDSPEEMVESATDIASWIYFDPADKMAFLELVRSRDEIVNHECLRKRRDGSPFWVSINVRAVRDEHGNVLQYHGFTLDITERKRTEEALRESEQRYREIFEATSDAIFIDDARTGRMLDVNEAMLKMYGYSSKEEVLAGNIGDLSAPEASCDEAGAQERIRAAVAGTPQQFEWLAKRRDGTVFPVEVALRRSPIGGQDRVIASVRDISERKAAEQEREKLQAQLLQAQKMESLGILAGGVAHDFNNLLHIMAGHVQHLLQGGPEEHPDSVRLRAVAKSIDRAAALVRQLLLFGRKAEFSRRKVDLNHEVEEVAKVLRQTIPRMIDVRLILAKNLWPVGADPVQVEQVLLNLAANAADAMPDGGVILIETENVELDAEFVRTHPESSVGPHVLMTVADTGVGITSDVRKHLFDPFFTTKPAGKGTGLGLASVYGIVSAHGGHVLCYSEPGQGATFKLYWPALTEDVPDCRDVVSNASCNAPSGMDRTHGDGETILLVDDEPEIRQLTQEALESFGYAVISAESGEQALEVYQRHRMEGRPVDLVLLDLNMPGMGGRRCLRSLLQLDPAVRILIASGYTAGMRGQEALSDGAKGFLSKPYRMAELAEKVREVLEA